MLTADILTSRLVLTCITAEHVTERYLRWLRDPEVTQFLETRFVSQDLDVLRRFVDGVRASEHSYQFAIMEQASDEHIGNIKLGPVNRNHSTASIGLFIGERSAWGRGYASEAIRAVSDWAFDSVGLQKLTAGAYERNAGSLAAFRKCGFEIEGVQRSQVRLDDGSRDNVVTVGKTAADHVVGAGEWP